MKFETVLIGTRNWTEDKLQNISI